MSFMDHKGGGEVEESFPRFRFRAYYSDALLARLPFVVGGGSSRVYDGSQREVRSVSLGTALCDQSRPGSEIGQR